MESRIAGYAARYNNETTIAGMFREVILPGAFRAAIGRDDCRALFNHDANYILGRTKSGTLMLTEDKQGLQHDVVLPDTAWAKDLYTSIKRGDVTQSSFSFRVAQESWVQGALPLRRIQDLELFDVSPVVFPAYEATSVSARGGSVELRGAGMEARSIAESLEALRRLRSLSAAPSKCERCRWDTAVRLMGEREGQRMLYYSLCSSCSERRHLDRQVRQLRGGDGSAQARLREFALRERELQLKRY